MQRRRPTRGGCSSCCTRDEHEQGVCADDAGAAGGRAPLRAVARRRRNAFTLRALLRSAPVPFTSHPPSTSHSFASLCNALRSACCEILPTRHMPSGPLLRQVEADHTRGMARRSLGTNFGPVSTSRVGSSASSLLDCCCDTLTTIHSTWDLRPSSIAWRGSPYCEQFTPEMREGGEAFRVAHCATCVVPRS